MPLWILSSWTPPQIRSYPLPEEVVELKIDNNITHAVQPAMDAFYAKLKRNIVLNVR